MSTIGRCARLRTVTARGYPQLLQVAEPYRGGIVTDRQHPHDVVSEAAVMYEHTVGTRVAGSLYAALDRSTPLW